LLMTDFIYYQCLSYIPSPSMEWRILSCILLLLVTPSHGQLWFDQVGGSIMAGWLLFPFYDFSVCCNWQVVLALKIGSWATLNFQQGNSILSATNLWVIYLILVMAIPCFFIVAQWILKLNLF
jgi:hypothetical protein